MSRNRYWSGLLSIIAALGACSGGEEPNADSGMLTITGDLAYRERIALPAGSVVNVVLSDISRADVAATEIARQTRVTSGEQVPLAFELSADRADLRPGLTYAVRAEIRDADDQLRWVTDTVHRVDVEVPGNSYGMGTLPLVAVSRTAASTDGEDALAGTRWSVVTIAGQSVPEDSRAALLFGEDGQLSGNASCNSFSGSYSLSGSELTAGQMAVTMMACMGPLSDYERNFLTVLTGTSRISFNAEGLLVIAAQNGDSIIARSAPEEIALADTGWRVISIDGQDVPEDSRAALNFSADGMLSGNGSCNSLSGGYSLSDGKLSAGQVAVTMMACPEPLMSLEQALLAILREPADVAIDESGLLSISAENGSAILAEPAEESAPAE